MCFAATVQVAPIFCHYLHSKHQNVLSLKYKTEEGDQYSRLYSEEMIALMEKLRLPRYGLNNYVNEKQKANASDDVSRILDNLSRAGSRMMGFCKSTFFKRMDSSGFSFLITLYHHILRNMVYVYAIDNNLWLPIGDENELPEDYVEDEDINAALFKEDKEESRLIKEDVNITFPTDLKIYREKAAEYYEFISQKNNVNWIESKYFSLKLKKHLIEDCKSVILMLWEYGQGSNFFCRRCIPNTYVRLSRQS
ncbi:MAG: hypothetical protein LUD48_02160 [Prevotella sp.]|nr:hypothetical protein [Prevotella sp.]